MTGPAPAKGTLQGHRPKVTIKERPNKPKPLLEETRAEGVMYTIKDRSDELHVTPAQPRERARDPNLVAQARISSDQVKGLMGITDEQIKYLKCWDVDAYRNFSPGEQVVPMFLEALGDEWNRDTTLIDWGCGTGRAGYALWKRGFGHVSFVDFAVNCLDEHVREAVAAETEKGDAATLQFIEHDITQKIELRSDFGYCCDVMEHLPPEEVDHALEVILENSTHVFFQIATTPDHFGAHPDIQHPLHLSVHGYQWWLRKFVDHGVRIHRSMERPGSVIFYVSGYTGFSFDKLQHNTSVEEVKEHMEANAARGFQNLQPHPYEYEDETNNVTCLILGGGPSLNDYVDEIRERRNNDPENIKVITLNNTYEWAIENGISPSMQFMIDAREFNKRFVKTPHDKCKYVIASQCHPVVTENLPKDRTYMWQVTLSPEYIPFLKEHFGIMYEDWYPCPGGSSVMNRALPALQLLGFRNIEIYGFDSCVTAEEHHAYDQPENDLDSEDALIKITVEGREFACHPWMLAQAKEFIDMRHQLIKHLNIGVHGDGLIAHLLQTGADVIEE